MAAFQRVRLSWRRATVAALLAALSVGGVWRWVNQRIAVVAPGQAAAGESLAVATLREDWPRSVGPAALSAPGAAGERARQLAGARLDLAISRATAGEPEVFRAIAQGLLQAMRDTEGPLTRSGVAWARWLTTRLVETSKVLDGPERFELLALADQATRSLASRPRLREPRAAQPAAEPLVITTPPPPPPLPSLVEPPRPEEPEPLAQLPPLKPLADLEPGPWQPAWSESVRQPVPDEPVTHVTPPDRVLPDRQLLARLLEVRQEVAAARTQEASAAGPVSAPRDTEPTDAERRLENLRLELASRGYQAVSAEHAEALLSPDEQTRLALVDKLLVARVTNAGRLLLLLSRDASGEVRAAAVSALGSTTDRALVQAALDAALHDRDPRVGRLAGALRERLK